MISQDKLDKCKDVLSKGLLIVYPTDTLYGIGANIFNKQAIEKAYAIKKRPRNLSLPIAVVSIAEMENIADMTPLSKKIATNFLPGSITMVLKQNKLPDWLVGRNKTIAIRIPNDPIALQILKNTGPLTITSANIHNQSTPTSIKDIRKMFKPDDIAEYIDDGIRSGLPSTIIDCRKDKPILLRKGSISLDEINSVVTLS